MSIRNSLDDIVSVTISIASPISSGESFSSILHISSQPDHMVESLPEFFYVSSAKELLEYGFTIDDESYLAATIVFNQDPAPSELYFSIRKKVEGIDENIRETLDRALDYDGWYGLSISADFQEDIQEVIEWTEENKKLFGYTLTHYESITDSADHYRSFAVYAGGADGDPEENKYAALALMAKCFCYQPGSETWAEKQLNSISPCKLTATQKKSLDTMRITYFTTYAGKNITSAQGGKVLANEWIDVIRFRDWLENDMQLKIFALKLANPKLMYTNAGITAVQGKMEESLKEGQRAGGIAETEYDADGKEVPGYTTSVPNAMDISDAQKASRILTDCYFSARIAGAIQATKVNGKLTY